MMASTTYPGLRGILATAGTDVVQPFAKRKCKAAFAISGTSNARSAAIMASIATQTRVILLQFRALLLLLGGRVLLLLLRRARPSELIEA